MPCSPGVSRLVGLCIDIRPRVHALTIKIELQRRPVESSLHLDFNTIQIEKLKPNLTQSLKNLVFKL